MEELIYIRVYLVATYQEQKRLQNLDRYVYLPFNEAGAQTAMMYMFGLCVYPLKFYHVVHL